MRFGEGEPHFDSPHRAQRPSIAPSTPGYENDDMVRANHYRLRLIILSRSNLLILCDSQGFMNGLPNIGGIGSPGMGLGFGSVHLT